MWKSAVFIKKKTNEKRQFDWLINDKLQIERNERFRSAVVASHIRFYSDFVLFEFPIPPPLPIKCREDLIGAFA